MSIGAVRPSKLLPPNSHPHFAGPVRDEAARIYRVAIAGKIWQRPIHWVSVWKIFPIASIYHWQRYQILLLPEFARTNSS